MKEETGQHQSLEMPREFDLGPSSIPHGADPRLSVDEYLQLIGIPTGLFLDPKARAFKKKNRRLVWILPCQSRQIPICSKLSHTLEPYLPMDDFWQEWSEGTRPSSIRSRPLSGSIMARRYAQNYMVFPSPACEHYH